MNPLLEPSKLKNSAIPFNLIKPEHFPPALDAAIATGRKHLDRIRTSSASFENTFRGLESCTEELEFVFTVFSNLLGANSNDELQKLSMKLGPKVASFSNDILLDTEIFARVKEVYEGRSKAGLNSEQIRLVEKVYRDFQRNGAGLDESGKKRLREIDERLSQLNPKFRENVLKSTNAFEMWIDNEADLAGLPESARTAAREAAAEKGKADQWLVTLQGPSFLPFMRFAENRTLREKLYRAYGSRSLGGEFDNQDIIREQVALMHEKANLLGSKSYAAYALQLRMAETPESVNTFLHRLLSAAKPAAEKELQELRDFAKSKGGPADLKPWDIHFYSEKLKEEKYSFDEESLRPYFKLENVIGGIFQLAKRLYKLDFVENREYPVYHPDVKVYEVYKTTPERDFVGLFYTDWFPRASKGPGAWMTEYCTQGVFRGKRVRPHISNVCNFTKPTADQPSLLTFDEVRTLFHEFGHGLHGLLSQVEFRSLAGTNVYLDFVELPSQIMENWAEEPEVLELFAHHYKTGEVIPRELIKKLKASQKFQVAYFTMRQLNFAFLDLAWFTAQPSKDLNVEEFENAATEKTRLMPLIPGINISASFGHIFGGGYASGYYSYKWAEALDADAFELFRERGVFDENTASRFEEFILSKGGSDHPMRLYEQFRGRSPDPDALLRRDGLLS